MGPQETLDWEFTIDNITDRLNTLETQNRSHAQRTADIQGAINMVDAKIVAAVEDIGEYKKFVTTRFDHFGNVAETKFNEVGANVAGMESNFATIENNCVVAGRRLDAMDGALTRMVDSMRALQAAFTTPGTAPPQTFNMSTPIQPTQQQQQPTVGAPGLNAFAGCGQPEQPAACGGRPLGQYPENLPQPEQPGMDPTSSSHKD